MTENNKNTAPADDLKPCPSPEAAVERLSALYDEAIRAVEQRFADYAAGKLKIGPYSAPTYPYLLA
jgi:hypothetical protein